MAAAPSSYYPPPQPPPPPGLSPSRSSAELHRSMETSQEAPPVELAHPEHYILFFDYRTLFESEDIDNADFEAWMETLDGFGYQDLDRAHYFKDLSLRTASQIMMSLCPYTTRQEWEPALNKRDVRLSKLFTDFCATNVLPMGGVREFLLSVSRHAKATVVLLSPFSESHTRLLLEKSSMRPLVDFVIPYQSLDTAALQALEVVDVPPPRWPSELDAHEMSKRWGARVSEPLELPTRYLGFVSSVAHAKALAHFGIASIGITYNNIDHEAMEEAAGGSRPSGRKVITQSGCDSDEAIAGAGLCKQVLRSFAGFTFGYLHKAAWAHTLAYQ